MNNAAARNGHTSKEAGVQDGPEPTPARPIFRWSAAFAELRPLLYVAATVSFVAVLSFAQAFLVPLALAVMLGFVLTSPVAALERRGLHRLVSVAVVVLVVLGAVVGFGYVVSHQFNDFASRLPQYSQSIKAKVATLREARKGAIGKIEETVAAASREWAKEEMATTRPSPQEATASNKVQSVLVVPSEPGDVERLRLMLTPVLTSIATAGVVLILVIFILMQREDIRNRVIHLVGRGRVTVTTRTLDEAGQRISEYLFSQSLVNVVFGTCIAAGLLVVGVPYALLWGMTAAVLRFVPYLGSLLAMLMPAALAFVGSPGWGPTIETVALFLALDAITAYVVEPLWIGTRTGVSSLALLISAMFWTWLWGPIGLLLSTPLTVCLAVIGKHVPEMEFLAALLGDEPPIEGDVTLYQRLLAGDEEGASEILDEELGKNVREHVFDNVVLPTLLLADRERLRDDISPAEHQFVVQTMFDTLRDRAESTVSAESEAGTHARPGHRILGVPVRTTSDQLALEMVSQLVKDAWSVQEMSTATLVSEVLQAIEETTPTVLCITALPPGGLSHASHLCKRVHSRFPDLPILVLRAGARADSTSVDRALSRPGRETVVTSFTEVLNQLTRLMPAAAEPSVRSTGEQVVSPPQQLAEPVPP